MKIYIYNNLKIDWSTGTAYIKTALLIQYICLKNMSEILLVTERMNLMNKSIAYQH